MDGSALCSRPSGLAVNEMIIARVIKRERERDGVTNVSRGWANK